MTENRHSSSPQSLGYAPREIVEEVDEALHNSIISYTPGKVISKWKYETLIHQVNGIYGILEDILGWVQGDITLTSLDIPVNQRVLKMREEVDKLCIFILTNSLQRVFDFDERLALTRVVNQIKTVITVTS
jgi:hypothetical protein